MPEKAAPGPGQDLNPFRLDELAQAACGENVDRWPPGLKAVLAACASASLAQEEGAYLRCAVALHPERRANSAQLMMIGFTPFAEPWALELNTLVKLGSGTTPTATCLVAAGDAHSDGVSLLGIARHPPPRLETSGFVWIELLGPGRLRVRGRGGRTVVHSPGAVRLERDTRELVAFMPRAAAEGLATEYSQAGHGGSIRIGGRPFKLKAPLPRSGPVTALREKMVELANGYVLTGLLDLASSIESLGHGGAILLASRAAMAQHPEVLTGGVEFGEEIREHAGSGWTVGLGAALALHAAVDLDRAKAGLFIDADAEGLRKHHEVVMRVWDQRRPALAAMATADGLLVLDEMLKLVAFKRRVTGVVGTAEFPEEVKRFLDGKGERHRSLAHAVQTLGTEAVGVAVSHDGGYTMFHCTPELRYETHWSSEDAR